MSALSTPSVVVVGAGPAGLAAARVLAKHNVGSVLVIDRDDQPGGLPRFCRHPGFGWEYSRRIESGPGFVRRLLEPLDGRGVTILTRTTMLGLGAGPELSITGPTTGPIAIQPQAVILATGIREKARGPRLVPGTRPEHGLYTTGLLQQLVHRRVPLRSRRMAIVGTEHVAFSALLTARHVGRRVVAMIEPGPRVLSFAAAGLVAQTLFRTPILLRTTVAEIVGSKAVEGLIIEGPNGAGMIDCDGVVFTAEWVPDSAGLAGSGVELDARTGGPIIDQMMRTTVPGVFAAGNLLRPVETSGFAALEGARAGACASAYVKGQLTGAIGEYAISASSDFRYVVPQRWAAVGDLALSTPRLRPSLRIAEDHRNGKVAVKTSEQTLWEGRCGSLLRARRIDVNLQTAFEHRDRKGDVTITFIP